MKHMIFIEKSGNHHICTFKTGETVLAVARRNDVDLEGACDGIMACSTCHVFVDKRWFDRLPKASAAENDTLDLASGVTRLSRLGCQIVLSDDLDGLTVRVA